MDKAAGDPKLFLLGRKRRKEENKEEKHRRETECRPKVGPRGVSDVAELSGWTETRRDEATFSMTPE